jgi:hypothetical protein
MHHPDCEHFADGGMIRENQEIENNPDLSIDHSVLAHGLLHLLTKAGHTRSEDPERPAEDHIHAVRTGRKDLESKSEHILDLTHEHKIKTDPKRVESLREHLEDLRLNPQKLLDIGGDLGGSMPDHAAALAAKGAQVMNHFEMIKPKPSQLSPLSPVIPPSSMEEARYRRQLGIAEDPSSIYQSVKEGRLQPEDLNTVRALYPKLLGKMQEHLTGAIVNAKTQEKPIAHKQRMGLGMVLGQPLGFIDSPQAAQAIIKANGTPQQPAPPPIGKGKKTGATAQTQKTIDKVNDLYETPLEASQIAMKQS